MKLSNHRKHCRSSSITQYEDFMLHQQDRKRISEPIADSSTKETPIRDTPISLNFNAEFNQVIESIKNKLELEGISKQQKNKTLRNQVLEIFLKIMDSPVSKGKKISKRGSNSIGAPIKKLKLGKRKDKAEIRLKKSSLNLKRKKHHKSMNLPKVLVRAVKSANSNGGTKPSFLV